jgi:hypothetical protein
MDFYQQRSLWDGCQLLLTASEPSQSPIQNDSTIIETIDNATDLSNALYQLGERRFARIGIASPSISKLIFDNRAAVEAIRRMCSGQTTFAIHALDLNVWQLRRLLHRVGFYEIAECHPNKHSNFDCSSVSGLPDGQFELQSSTPATSSSSFPFGLIASRYALPLVIPNPWSLYGTPLLYHESGGVSSSDDPEIGLAIQELLSIKAASWSKLNVTGQICWDNPMPTGAFAALVACHNGPGDSNMYAAMIDTYAEPFAQVSLWCCHRGWERIAYTHFPLVRGKPRQSVRISLIVGPDTVELQIGNERVLWAYDDRIPRTASYGMRMRGNQFNLQELSAAVE